MRKDVALLRAVASMVQRGEKVIDHAVNAIQSLIAVKDNGMWFISIFQNTPAQFHGRPKLSEALTEELQQEVKKWDRFAALPTEKIIRQ